MQCMELRENEEKNIGKLIRMNTKETVAPGPKFIYLK